MAHPLAPVGGGGAGEGAGGIRIGGRGEVEGLQGQDEVQGQDGPAQPGVMQRAREGIASLAGRVKAFAARPEEGEARAPKLFARPFLRSSLLDRSNSMAEDRALLAAAEEEAAEGSKELKDATKALSKFDKASAALRREYDAHVSHEMYPEVIEGEGEEEAGIPARRSSLLALSLFSLAGVQGSFRGEEGQGTKLADYAEALKAADASAGNRSNFFTDCFRNDGSFNSEAARGRRAARADAAGQKAYDKVLEKTGSREEARAARAAAANKWNNPAGGFSARLMHYFHPGEVRRDWGKYMVDFASRDIRGGFIRTGQACKLEYLKTIHVWNNTKGVHGLPSRILIAGFSALIGLGKVAITAVINILRAALVGLPIMLLNMAGRNILYFAALTVGLFFGIKAIVTAAVLGVAAPHIAWGAAWAANKAWIIPVGIITACVVGFAAIVAKDSWMVYTIKRQGKQINALEERLGLANAAEEPLLRDFAPLELDEGEGNGGEVVVEAGGEAGGEEDEAFEDEMGGV